MNKIDAKLDLLCRAVPTGGSNTVIGRELYSFQHKDADLKLFPINDKETFAQVEEKLQPDSDFFKKVVCFLFCYN